MKEEDFCNDKNDRTISLSDEEENETETTILNNLKSNSNKNLFMQQSRSEPPARVIYPE